MLLKRTYPIVKSVSSDIKVISGCVTHKAALTELFNLDGAMNFMDGAAYHWGSWTTNGYVRDTYEERGNNESAMEPMIELMKKGGKVVPLWDTECHLTQADTVSEYLTQPTAPLTHKTSAISRIDSANAVVRQSIMEWAIGTGKTFLWSLAAPSVTSFKRSDLTLLLWDRSPSIQIVTYAVMTSLLENAVFEKMEKKIADEYIDSPTFWTVYFRVPAGKIRVVFGSSDEAYEMMFPAGPNVVVKDMFGVDCPGAKTKSGLELKNEVMLNVARSPIYICEFND